MESDDDSDSPDSIVPASSPESVLGEELLRFPLLSEAKPELEERVLSPIIPIIPRASIPGGMGWRVCGSGQEWSVVHKDWARGSLWGVQHREGIWSLCVR